LSDEEGGKRLEYTVRSTAAVYEHVSSERRAGIYNDQYAGIATDISDWRGV
jgi:hypothetical protein